MVLSHKDRTRIVAEGTTVWTEIGWGTALVDGFTAARWKFPRETDVLHIEPFRRLTRAERDDLTAEGMRLLAFLGVERGSVRIGRPG